MTEPIAPALEALLILESLQLSIKWELSPMIRNEIGRVLPSLRAALLSPRPVPAWYREAAEHHGQNANELLYEIEANPLTRPDDVESFIAECREAWHFASLALREHA